MRHISIFLSLVSMPCIGEVIYYDTGTQSVEIRSTQPTLLKFDAIPLSSACHPADIEFDTIESPPSYNDLEPNKAEDAKAYEEDQTIKQMIRAKPLRLEGKVKCSFTLTGGNQVNAEFTLKQDLEKPMIEFLPLPTRIGNDLQDQNLFILQSLMEGKTMSLEKHSQKHKTCSSSNNKACQNYRFQTEFADYEITSALSNSRISAWIIVGKVRKGVQFKDIADFKPKEALIQTSLTLPHKTSYEPGDSIRHCIIGSLSLKKEDFKEILK